MRNSVTISLPDAVLKDVHREVKKGKFASVSEYIRHVLREREEVKLRKELNKMRENFEAGKFKVLKDVSEMDTW